MTDKRFGIVQELVTAVLALACLSPFYLLVANMGKTSTDIITDPIGWPQSSEQFWENVSSVTNHSMFNFRNALGCSVTITLTSLGLLVLFSSMTAWVLARNRARWSRWLFTFFLSAMVIPFQAVMLPMLSTYRSVSDVIGISLLRSYPGIIIAYLGFGSSLSVFIIHGFIKGIPYELEEAAMIDGCSPEGTFFRIIFPILRPVQVTVLILNGIWIWNDFLLPSLLLSMNGDIKTLPLCEAVGPDPNRRIFGNDSRGDPIHIFTALSDQGDGVRRDQGMSTGWASPCLDARRQAVCKILHRIRC